MTFSQKIYFLRTKRKLTQTELAKLTGLTQGAIAHYENGKILKPSAEALIALSKVFSIKPEILLDDERSVINE